MRLYKLLSVSYIQYSNTESYLKNAHCKTILFCILVYPSIISLFKHLSRLVCIEWCHYALLAAVLMFLRASSRCCVRNSLSGIPLALALSLLSMRLWARCRPQSPLSDSLLPAPRRWGKGCRGELFRLCVWGGNDWVSVSRHSSSISRFVLPCTRKLSLAFIPPTVAEENKSPLIGGIFMITVKFSTR